MPRLKTTKRKKLLRARAEKFPTSALFAAECSEEMGRPIPAEMRAN
ncbi:MAG TPA: hypothetical protein VKP58_03570 [Candidatus Acidoferrum sp.]|nr:hypothetical protein [Candidatus Acidoferrum sp.]